LRQEWIHRRVKGKSDPFSLLLVTKKRYVLY
jgi:hypothetical protein